MWKCSCRLKRFSPLEEKLSFSLPFTHEKKLNISTFSRNSRKNLSLGFKRGKKNFWNFSRFSVLFGKYSAGNLFFTQFQTLNFSFLLVFPFRLEKMLSVMIKWNKIIIIVWKCSLRKEKKKISCVKLDASLFPRFIFLLKFIFHKWINTKVQCLKQLDKISHRMTKTFSPTLFHSRRKKNFPLKK